MRTCVNSSVVPGALDSPFAAVPVDGKTFDLSLGQIKFLVPEPPKRIVAPAKAVSRLSTNSARPQQVLAVRGPSHVDFDDNLGLPRVDNAPPCGPRASCPDPFCIHPGRGRKPHDVCWVAVANDVMTGNVGHYSSTFLKK